MKHKITLPTITEIPDDLWQKIRRLFPPQKKPGTPGRPALSNRQVLNGILFVMRTGCQWKAVPRVYGSGSTLHRRFQQWTRLNVFEKLWQLMLRHYHLTAGIDWQWQALDSVSIKAPLGGQDVGPNPTDRGKGGSKRHVLTDRRGVPIAIRLSAANVHDKIMAIGNLDCIAIIRPRPTSRHQQHLCLDKGYDYEDIRAGVAERNYILHCRRRGVRVDVPFTKRHPARRWVVERTNAWHNGYRRLLVRWERTAANYLALVHFASALMTYRVIYNIVNGLMT